MDFNVKNPVNDRHLLQSCERLPVPVTLLTFDLKSTSDVSAEMQSHGLGTIHTTVQIFTVYSVMRARTFKPDFCPETLSTFLIMIAPSERTRKTL